MRQSNVLDFSADTAEDRTENAFCSQSKESHSIHRRRIAAVYTKSALFKSAQLMAITEAIVLKCLIPRLNRDISNCHYTELLELSYSMSLDLVDAFLFGLSNGSKFLSKEEDILEFLEHYENRYCAESFWPQEMPLFTKILGGIGVNLLPKSARVSKEWMESWLLKMCQAAEAALLRAGQSSAEKSADHPTVYACLRNATHSSPECLNADLRQAKIASELFDQMCEYRSFPLGD